ncbi:MAG: ABC transporter substrate-binding protein [Proteobacteria bacterium]|nr:ABC transporter substrate-binding protein [Pseudomonadota bacterium]
MYTKITLLIAAVLSVFIYLSYFTKDKTLQNKVVAITQIAPHPSLDRIRQGIEDEIKSAFGDKIKIEFQSAQGNPSLATQIAHNFIGKNVDVLVAITTPSAQAMHAANSLNIPMVFAGVTDPIAAKLVEESGANKDNITGVCDTPDIDKQVSLIQEFLPKNSAIGIIYNPGETNSRVHVERLEEKLQNAGFIVIKTPAYSTGDVLQASQGTVPNVNAIMLTNDNTVISAIDAVIQTARQHNIPVFCSDPESVKRGAKEAIAPDQYEMGIEAGKMVVRILKGEKGHHIPVLHAPTSRFSS